MVDRAAREQLASILRSYMNEEITAFQLDERLYSFRRFPKDETVELIAADLWGCYDDLRDHKVVAQKETWDYFNRILLLLSSDAELEKGRSEFQWRLSQVPVGLCLLLELVLAVQVGWNLNILSVLIPFGLISMAINWTNQRHAGKTENPETYPFPSFGSLASVRRGTAVFSKVPWPKAVGHRKIRHPLVTAIILAPTIMAWLVLSPCVLFFQTLPEKRWNTRMRLSSSELPSAAR